MYRFLCLPGAVAAFAFAVLLTTSAAFSQQQKPAPDPNRWEATIKGFEASDKTNQPPKSAVLFIGSSSIRLWKTLTNDFPEFPVINRGFGGSEISDSLRYVNRIVTPYRPKAIVLYAGENDIAAGKNPQQVFEDFKRFVYKVHWSQPGVTIYFVSAKPSPARWKYKDHMIEINRLVKEFCATERNLRFIDVFSPMIGSDGGPRPELFIKDNLHMNHTGYKLWTSILKPHLLATMATEKK